MYFKMPREKITNYYAFVIKTYQIMFYNVLFEPCKVPFAVSLYYEVASNKNPDNNSFPLLVILTYDMFRVV